MTGHKLENNELVSVFPHDKWSTYLPMTAGLTEFPLTAGTRFSSQLTAACHLTANPATSLPPTSKPTKEAL